jgi:hypothetical protein
MYPILFFHYLPTIVFGSPSFARYEFRDETHDWKLISGINETRCKMILHDIKIPDLDGISYVSDGKTLNATFWLNGRFEETNLTDFRQPNYAMGIILTHVNPPKVDYLTSIYRDQFHNWTKNTQEILPESGDTKVLEKNENYSGFFDNGDPQGRSNRGHVTLSLNLDRIKSPEQFILFFSLQDFYKDGKYNGCLIIDIGDNVAYVPQPKFTISAEQTSLRPGEEGKVIDLKINSNIIITPNITLSVRNQTGLTLKLLNDQPYLNTAGFAASLLKVKALDNATSRTYHIPINANISFPKVDLAGALTTPSTPFKSLELGNLNTSYSPSISLNATILAINVLEKLTPLEQFDNFWKSFGGLIALIGGGFAAGFSALVFDRFKKKKKRTDLSSYGYD